MMNTIQAIASQKLAIHGGPKAVSTPLPHWPSFDENAIRSVEQVMRSGKVNYWTGKRGMEFEREFARWQGSAHGISVATGTAALHVGLSALGVGPGDEVIVPSYTFIASSFSICTFWLFSSSCCLLFTISIWFCRFCLIRSASF